MIWRLSMVLAMCLRAVGGPPVIDHHPPPRWEIPKLATPPTIDGTVGAEEWAAASSISGMVNWGAEGKPGDPGTLLPPVQQVRWFLGYDDKHLYLAMDSPHPEGTALCANVKQHDNWHAILFDDHTELQFQVRGARDVAPENGGFYKVMVNPRGTFSDQWHRNGTPGTEDDWTSGANVKCTVTDTGWQMEIAFPLDPMNPALPIDGSSWIVQLLRADHCSGIYFAGWVGEAWMAWPRFGEVVFQPQAPSFHLRRLGDLVRGQLDAQIDLRGRRANETVTVAATLLDAADKPIYAQTKTAKLGPGATATVAFQQADLPISPEHDDRGAWQSNHFELMATSTWTDEAGAHEEILYRVRIPVIEMSQRRWDKVIAPWLERRAGTTDFAFNIAYYPYIGRFAAWVDLDLFGVPKEIQQAETFRVRVADAAGNDVATATGAVEHLLGRVSMPLPDLAAGDYTAAVVLVDGAGATVGTQKHPFKREVWPWEHNDIGTADIVLPPFTAVTAEDTTLRCWNRDYVLGPAGLPEQIVIGRDDRVRGWRHQLQVADLFGGHPIRLDLTSDGQAFSLQGAGATVNEVTDTGARVAAGGSLGPLSVRTTGRFEYDGWYEVTLELTPAGPVPVEALDMLWQVPGADTVAVHRKDKVRDSFYGPFPAGDGVVWDSTRLNPTGGLLGTWAPAVFLGTGERGIWYLAESDEGWLLDDDTPAIQLERLDGVPTVRFRLVNKSAVIDRPRTIRFAMIAYPCKPLPKEPRGGAQTWRKIAWGWPIEWYHHSTSGQRAWGYSKDGLELYSDADYARFRDRMTGFQEIPPKTVGGCRPWLEDGRPLVLYGTARMCGIAKEFDTFAGEWLGQTNFRGMLRPWNSERNKYSWAGILWETEEQVSPVVVNHTPSYLDFHVWYTRNLVTKVGISGTWWDNQSIAYGGPLDLGLSYVRDDGSVQGKASLASWREQTKRLVCMGWQNGRPPIYLQNMNPLCSFTQIGWHIENSFHLYQQDYPAGHFGDASPVDVFRALILTKQGIIHRLAYGGRTNIGLCLLHDVGKTSAADWVAYSRQEEERILGIMEQHVRFFSGLPEFVPYWRQELVTTSTPGVYISVYRHVPVPSNRRGRHPERPPKAIAVVFNDGPERYAQDLRFDARGLGLDAVTRVTDAETGIEFSDIVRQVDKRLERLFGDRQAGEVFLHRHDWRLLLIE